jgi:DNA-binding NtrC family response regulator
MHMTTISHSTLLVIEDEAALRRGIADYLADSGYRVLTAENGKVGLELFQQEAIDLVFTDLRMPVMGGHELLDELGRLSPATPVIVISGVGDIKEAIEALRRGAWDYLVKPVHDLNALEHLARRALETTSLRREVEGLKQKLLDGSIQQPETFAPIITRSPAMLALFRYLEVIAPSRQPVLIQGETGVGKELFARAVHQLSGCNGKMVAVNLAGLDDQMFCDTLFGHSKGAFTGADQARDGLLAQAAGGTIFLDEIGDLREASQIKLLRLLQEGEYYPLGSDFIKKSDARLVLATHRDLKAMSQRGEFRQDLYYRLTTHQILIPPLRERYEDLPLLLDHFLREAAESLHRQPPAIPPELPAYLAAYDFPGNIRELRAMVFEAVARHTRGILSINSFLSVVNTPTTPPPSPGCSEYCVVIKDAHGERIPTLKEAEAALITQALRLAKGNQGVAAGYLGIQRSTLCKKLAKERLIKATSAARNIRK